MTGYKNYNINIANRHKRKFHRRGAAGQPMGIWFYVEFYPQRVIAMIRQIYKDWGTFNEAQLIAVIIDSGLIDLESPVP